MNLCNHITLHPDSIIYEHGMMRDEIAHEQINEIAVVTTDEGPFVDDVFLVLSGGDKEIKIPQEAENFEALFDVFKKFEGFNFEAFIEAMSSTENAKFVCWRRADKPEGSRGASRSEA